VTLLTHLAAQHCLRRQARALRPDLYRLAWSWCHDAALADDLVQDTLVRGLERAEQLRDPDQLKVWLCRILFNLHVDHLRARRPALDSDELPLLAEEEPEGTVARAQLVGRVREAVAALKEEHRKVVTLVDLMGLSYAEVASILEVPVGTVMSRLHRARERLREALQGERARADVTHLRSVR
jgi:RNA polymerase sigma-70 factor (ECF subfamily)